MVRQTGLLLVAASLLGVTPALAGSRCHVPLANWQTREAVQEKAQSLGWTVNRIKTDDGCYKVYGTTGTGEKVKAKLDPATLEIIQRDKHHD